jgi:DNA-binding transcriptional LysR family regulator
MQDLNDLALYAAVVRHKGFTAAANALSVPKSKISKRIAALEEQLGVRLIERSTRKLSITDIGQSFYERCEAVLSGVEAAEAVVAVAKAEPSGMVRMAMPPGFAPAVSDVLPSFMKRYPQVRLSILTTGRPVDLIEERIDVALRVRDGYDTDQSLIVRRFGGTRRYLAASPRFSGAPRADRPRHDRPRADAVHAGERRQGAIWTLVQRRRRRCATSPIRPVLHVLGFQRAGARERPPASASACCRTCMAERGFRAGALSPVLPDWSQRRIDRARRLHLPPRHAAGRARAHRPPRGKPAALDAALPGNRAQGRHPTATGRSEPGPFRFTAAENMLTPSPSAPL